MDEAAIADGSPEAAALVDVWNVAASSPCFDFVSLYARQQDTNIYCGPATVQVVSNYAWGIFSNTQNHFTQEHISDTWVKADANGGTSASTEKAGMNGSTSGHRPCHGSTCFVYDDYQVTSGYDWHAKIITDIHDWNMPLTAAVAPHDVGYAYFLTSWPNANTTGHWIAIRGYYGAYDGTSAAYVYYADSSGNGMGGSTGLFGDPSLVVYKTLIKQNPIHKQGRWIVW